MSARLLTPVVALIVLALALCGCVSITKSDSVYHCRKTEPAIEFPATPEEATVAA